MKKSPMIIIAWFDLWLECVRKDQFFDQYYDRSIYGAGESWMTWTWQYIWKMTLNREKNALSLYVDSIAIFDSFQFFFFHRLFPGSQFLFFLSFSHFILCSLYEFLSMDQICKTLTYSFGLLYASVCYRFIANQKHLATQHFPASHIQCSLYSY